MKENRHAGFSLVEMLISMVVFSIVMGIIYSFLLQTKKDLSESEVELDLTDNAQTAINSLRKDLYQIGIGRDTDQNQPQILRAGMFDLMFVADLDREIRSTEKRYGSPNHEDYTMLLDPGEPFFPLKFLYSTPESLRFSGWDPNARYGYLNMGAEIVRYSLDCNGDNVVNALDLEDNIVMTDARQNTMNPNDFWLFKEWWGVVNVSGTYINQHSGRHPVAFNLRGLYFNPEGSIQPSWNSRFLYPNAGYPNVLFTYWGHFWNSVTDHDDPSDPEWPGEPLDLWGDFGLQNPIPLDQPTTPDANGARNGVLDRVEIEEMMWNSLKSEINLQYLFGSSGRYGESINGDENGNGIPGESRIDQFIRRIGVNVVVEADTANPKAPNLERSNLSNPAAPVYYLYKDYEISIQVNPRNLLYTGSPVVDMGQMTPTPLPPTATPVPPTNTPDPSIPTNTPTIPPTPDPFATPTATPNAFGYDENDGEFIMGGFNYIYGMTVSRSAPQVFDVCNMMNSDNYTSLFGFPVTRIRPVNLCDTVGFFDEWNDVVFTNNSGNGAQNLWYYKHNPSASVNGFSAPRLTSIGTHPDDRITSFAAGNIGTFGFVDTEYDEVVVAYHRYDGTANERNFLEILALNAPCGDLLTVSSPAPMMSYSNRIIKDMLIDDFDGDGVGELVTMTSHVGGEGYAQIRYYPDIHGAGWSLYHDFPPLDFGTNVQCAKLVSGTVYTGNNKPVEPDLIVVAENGQFAVFTNRRAAPGSPNPWNTTVRFSTSEAFTRFSTVTDAALYDSSNMSGPYAPLLAICGNSDTADDVQLVHYDMSNTSLPTIPLNHCSGSIWPVPNQLIATRGMSYVPVMGTFGIDTYLVIPTNVAGIDYVVFLKNPAMMTGPLYDPNISCQKELYTIIGGINCITSTRNALSGELGDMSTPTPAVSPTP